MMTSFFTVSVSYLKLVQIKTICNQHCVSRAWVRVASSAQSRRGARLLLYSPHAETARWKRRVPRVRFPIYAQASVTYWVRPHDYSGLSRSAEVFASGLLEKTSAGWTSAVHFYPWIRAVSSPWFH